MVTELSGNERDHTASLILNLGLAASLLPLGIALGALLLMQLGLIDWWSAYGVVLIGDGQTLPLAIQALLASVVVTAAGVGAALWAGPAKFYRRAVLNLSITGASLIVLMAIAS